ncbi:MAG: SpoIIE family protein phosphatase [Brevinematales bacterium]|nr:SpoIIE family protein phosphatase [Brevinematales bacterium]
MQNKNKEFFNLLKENSIKIFGNFPFPYLIIDNKGIIIFHNMFFLKILDKTHSLIGENIKNFFSIEEADILNFIKSSSSSLFTTYKIFQKENPEKVYSVNIQKLNINKKSYLQLFFQDISLEFKLFNQLEVKNKLMEDELTTAKRILDHIFYISPIYNSYVRFETFFKPSEKLGGDFFDIFQVDQDKVGVFIADVSGHGVSASLITATLKMLITLTPKDFYSVDKMVFYLNSTLLQLLIEDQFVTLFYGIIDTKNYEIEYINCGHPMPIIFSERDKKIYHLEKITFPLGINLNLSYSKYIGKEKLPDFCKILFYTDGLFSFHKNRETISVNELKNIFLNLITTKQQNIVNKIYLSLLQEYERFEEDDISMLLVTLNKNFGYKNYLSIPSNILEADNAIIKLISSIERTFNLSEEIKWKIYTCLYEAVINAIIHGNKSNIQKRVFISYRIFKNWIIFKIRDEGRGFNIKEIPDPSKKENILKTSGRGIFMIGRIMNKIKFNKTGNEITMYLRVE